MQTARSLYHPNDDPEPPEDEDTACPHCDQRLVAREVWDDSHVLHCRLCGWVKYVVLPAEVVPDVPEHMKHDEAHKENVFKRRQLRAAKKAALYQKRAEFGALCLSLIKSRWQTYHAFSKETGIPPSTVRLVCVGRMGKGAMRRVAKVLGLDAEVNNVV